MIALLAFVIGLAVGVGFMCVAIVATGWPEDRPDRCGHDPDCGDVR